MYVCVCRAITERQVREAVGQGLNTVRDLRNQLGLASECGKCIRCAQGIIKECSNTCPKRSANEPCAA